MESGLLIEFPEYFCRVSVPRKIKANKAKQLICSKGKQQQKQKNSASHSAFLQLFCFAGLFSFITLQSCMHGSELLVGKVTHIKRGHCKWIINKYSRTDINGWMCKLFMLVKTPFFEVKSAWIWTIFFIFIWHSIYFEYSWDEYFFSINRTQKSGKTLANEFYFFFFFFKEK